MLHFSASNDQRETKLNQLKLNYDSAPSSDLILHPKRVNNVPNSFKHTFSQKMMAKCDWSPGFDE